VKYLKVAVLWVVAPYSLVDVYRRFRSAYWLYYLGDDEATTQQIAAFILSAVMNSNLKFAAEPSAVFCPNLNLQITKQERHS
jgi:hypothetical protein